MMCKTINPSSVSFFRGNEARVATTKLNTCISLFIASSWKNACQSACPVLGRAKYTGSYGALLEATYLHTRSIEAVRKMYRCIVFSCLIGNGDHPPYARYRCQHRKQRHLWNLRLTREYRIKFALIRRCLMSALLTTLAVITEVPGTMIRNEMRNTIPLYVKTECSSHRVNYICRLRLQNTI